MRVSRIDTGAPADLAVVIAYGKLLPARSSRFPSTDFSTFTLAASALSRRAPIQRAIEAGERETGVTIMRVDEELDHGSILEMERIRSVPTSTLRHSRRDSPRPAESCSPM